METRIKITGKYTVTGRDYQLIAYEILNGEVYSLPTPILARSETTGILWRITIGAAFGRFDDIEKAMNFPPLFLTPVNHHGTISEGDILETIASAVEI